MSMAFSGSGPKGVDKTTSETPELTSALIFSIQISGVPDMDNELIISGVTDFIIES